MAEKKKRATKRGYPCVSNAMACFLCGKKREPSKVVIRDTTGDGTGDGWGKIVGVVCGHHTLAEAVLFPGKRGKRVDVQLTFFKDVDRGR